LKGAHAQEWRSLTEKPSLNHANTGNQLLKIRIVKRKEHFLFNLLCFLYFRRSDVEGRFPIETHPLATFIIIPYVFFGEVYFFRSLRYFVTIDQRIVGLLALRQKTETMFISVLASHPFYRRMGVASFAINHAVMLARKLRKTSLELAVLKTNKPALKLYNKLGFYPKEEKRRSYIFQYQL
jgi:ribosomal protein S18 acetylase RimI-like enzyme